MDKHIAHYWLSTVSAHKRHFPHPHTQVREAREKSFVEFSTWILSIHEYVFPPNIVQIFPRDIV